MTGSRILVGTSEACAVRVTDDPYVSSQHCEVWKDAAGRLLIQDVGSANGTFIQRGTGRFRVYGPTQIVPGDTIWLGARTAIPWGSIGGRS